MDQYTYTNCFELNNNNNDVSTYLFDASFSNQEIKNETDCADYAFYNNHPSFFFQNAKNGNNKDISRCFVFNYNKNYNNDENKDKKIASDTINNLNYDFKNNINLPMYNFKEIYNEDGTKGYQPLEQDKCSSSSNPYKKSFKYFLLKSFSNNYDLDYNKLNKRPRNIRHSLLREYKNATYISNIPIDPNKKAFFNEYFDIKNPSFKNLYANNNTIYNDMITIFINNTFKYVSTNFFGICISNNEQISYDYIYQTDGNMMFYSFYTAPTASGAAGGGGGAGTAVPSKFYEEPAHRIIKSKIPNNWITTPGYNADNKYFNEQFYVSTKYLGLPLNLLRRWCKRQNSLDFINNNMFTPKNYDIFEKIFQDYIHISFFSFLIEVLELKLESLGNNFIENMLSQGSTDDASFKSYMETLNIGEIHDKVAYKDSIDNYSFSYLDILYCLYRNNTTYILHDNTINKVKTYIFDTITQDTERTNLQNDVVEHFLLDLLVLKYRVSSTYSIDHDTTIRTINKLIDNTKTYMHPQIKKYLTPIDPLPTQPEEIQSYEKSIGGGIMNENLIELFKKIYLGDFRLYHTAKFFDDRIRILTDENELIMNDIINMKTYIDNIYLHSKLNNIEDYIFNEKSKLNYLFNKNSSARQKNDDLNFLNNFTLIENVILCIMIFILILFFIKK